MAQQVQNNFKFSKRSLEILENVNPVLQTLTKEALKNSEIDFCVIDGIRTVEEETKLRKQGKSWTKNSKHLYGKAVDVAPYPIDFNDYDKYYKINEAFKKASLKLNISYRWGGDWNKSGDWHDEIKRGSYDGGHFEI